MNTTFNKRNREKQRQERQQEKESRRRQRREDRENRVPGAASDVDPDIAGIVPGPQPVDPDGAP